MSETAVRRVLGFAVAALILIASARGDDPPPPVRMTAQQDHQRMMDLLKIKELRRGADGNNRSAPNAASKLAIQIGVDMASNVMKEFYPDLRRRLSRKHSTRTPGDRP